MTQRSATQTRLVVGCDLRETGDFAARQAVQMARQAPSSELHFTYVIPGAHHLHDARRLQALASELPAKLDELRQRVLTTCRPAPSEPPFEVECVFHVRLGDPAVELHQLAVDCDASMIIVGTRGRTRAEELILGAVGTALMRLAQVSVLVAHPNRVHELPKLPKVSKMSKMPRFEPLRAGQQLEDTGPSTRLHLEFVPRPPHISGLM